MQRTNPMDKTIQQPETSHREGRISRFTRRHPGLTIAGLAVAGLAGGVELAAGVVLGAGVAALVRRPREAPAPSEPSAQPEARMHELRQRFEERARAVISAARGEIGVPAH
jgi:hypothetical protein